MIDIYPASNISDKAVRKLLNYAITSFDNEIQPCTKLFAIVYKMIMTNQLKVVLSPFIE